ncbi:MAG: TIGR01906 family membrane protein [Candidatus Promineifilaceae bacterium]|nr:TIGR01906 family membrane protein [Candidatus Promineifilaceae bacterium]
MSRSRLFTTVKWLVVVAMPIFLGFSTIRLFVNNAELYVRYEYGKASFPPDLHNIGEVQRQRLDLEPFTPEQRRELALVAVEYLQRPEPPPAVIHLLEEQRLPGTDRPLYNEAEIDHMLDVKRLTDAIARINWFAAAIVLGGLGILAVRRQTRHIVYEALFHGGVATVTVLLFIGLFILLAWNTFFVQFHELLFPPDSWSFAYTDSLIRLFPEKFWFDFGVLLSVTALLLGVVTGLLGYLLRRK